jgi:mono/diheme cytochrome c family protein
MRPLLAFAFAFAPFVLLGACRSPAGNAGGDAGTSPSAPAPLVAPVDGRTLAAANCMGCHAEEMLAQQRLTSAQWSNVVKKMAGWGATIEPENVPALVAYLSANYGPDAGPWVAAKIGASQAADELAALDDGPFAGGDAERGRARFAERCAPCHGDDARGKLGLNLVDRPLLYRGTDFAAVVRRGRGKMPPLPSTDQEIADTLAHLRRLR